MEERRKPIRLGEHEDSLLRSVYVHFRIPRDQFKKRPEDLAAFTRMFNRLSGRHDESQELIRYMQNQQKAKRRLKTPWPTFDGTHKRSPALSGTLDVDEMEALRDAYQRIVLPLDLGVDAVFWHQDVLNDLADEFARLTGKIVPGFSLAAIAEEKRKRRLWFTVGRQRRDDRADGFGDLDAVEDLD